jgi:hypothetical protein
MVKINELPEDHELRNCPVNHAWVRFSFIPSINVTDTEEQRIPIRESIAKGERVWSPWKKVRDWKISRLTYNQLGLAWTANHEWTFDNPKNGKGN